MTMETQRAEQPVRKVFRIDPSRGVAKVIGDEVRLHGVCRIGRPEIARRAGITKTPTKWWLQQLVDHGMIEIETQASGSVPSIIKIVSPTWLAMLGR